MENFSEVSDTVTFSGVFRGGHWAMPPPRFGLNTKIF